MFKKNATHNQMDLFAVSSQLNKNQQKLWDKSKEHYFYLNIFSRINESKFAILFSDKKSRPNTPVNQLVGALILKHLYNWTFEQLFTNLNFNLLTRHALGVHSINDSIFCRASLFNFQSKLIDHLKQSGEDLIENVFHQLTEQQIIEMGVDTSIQRGDSFLVGSNIMDYTRLGLLIEVVKRISRVLNDKDKALLEHYIGAYCINTSTNYIYHVEKEDLNTELNNIALVYYRIKQTIKDRYIGCEAYENFNRVYQSHFRIVNKQIEARASKELGSNILMSPDDPEATYRDKRSATSKGYVTHLSETANPVNAVNLITDICVYPNNVGDAEILEDRLPLMIDKTPEIAEYFVDGQYGSYGVDKIAEANDIKLYQNTSRGRKSSAAIRVYRNERLTVKVRCGGGQDVDVIPSKKTKGRFKALFDLGKCENCPLKDVCKLKIVGTEKKEYKRAYYFGDKTIKAHKRLENIKSLNDDGKKRFTRANVEATVKEGKRGMKNKKVRVRRRIPVSQHMILTAIAINLTRLHKIMVKKSEYVLLLLHETLCYQIIKIENNVNAWSLTQN